MSDDIGSEADGCDWGDKRLNVRYRLLLERLGDQPQLSIPAACRGEAEVEAAYRFFDHHPSACWHRTTTPPDDEWRSRRVSSSPRILPKSI